MLREQAHNRKIRKKRTLQTIALILVATIGWSTAAHADVIRINFTGDNVIGGDICLAADTAADCADSSFGSFSDPIFTSTDDWRTADSIWMWLPPGAYYIVWYVENSGSGLEVNSAGLLAEIFLGSFGIYSSSGWDVSTDGSSWTAATSYGNNGGANIWTDVNGGAVSGISTSAEWIWTSNNFNSDMDQSAYFRTSFRVPEPGTLALLGLGLLAMGIARRRKV